MKRIPFIAVLGFILSSCSILEGDTVKCNSYITTYSTLKEVSFRPSSVTDGDGQQWWMFSVSASLLPRVCDVFDSSDESARLLDSLSRANNDTGWPAGTANEYNRHFALENNIVKVKLTAISDWDGSHPAKSSLNDLATFAALSMARFIDSGYTPYDCSKIQEGSLLLAAYPFLKDSDTYDSHPVLKPLTQVTTEDLRLVWGQRFDLFYLFIPKLEGDEGDRGLTVTLTDSRGNEISRSTVTGL